MRKGYLRVGVLFMGLLVVLGAIGIVNGLWSKNLRVDAVVTTGDLNADWDCGYVSDDGANNVIHGTRTCTTAVVETGDDGLDNSVNWAAEAGVPEKDVGECHLAIGNTEFGDQYAKVTINNGYPLYNCDLKLWLSNSGSIPFNFYGATMEAASASLAENIELTPAGCIPAEAGAGVQVDPGQEHEIGCNIKVLQPADQSVCSGTTSGVAVTENCNSEDLVTYEFSLYACVAQWNESTTLANCQTHTDGTNEGPQLPAAP